MSRYPSRDYDLARRRAGGELATPAASDASRNRDRKLDYLFEMKSEMESMCPPVCRSVKFGLCVLGIWPGVSYATLCKFLCVSSMLTFQAFQYQYLIVHFGEEELSILMDALSLTLAYSLLFIKMFFFYFNRRLLNETLGYVFEDWKVRDVSDDAAMTRMAHASRVFSNVIIGTYAISVLFYAIGTLMEQTGGPNGTRVLILRMDLPFEMKDTSVYVAVILTQFIHHTSAASMVAVLNSLLLTLVLHVCGQIDIVRRKLSEITRERDVAPKDVIKSVIVRHQRIIAFSRNIEALFSYIALIQFISSTFVICFAGFLVVISLGVPNGSMVVIKFMLFYIAISLDGFIFCYVGEYLSMKSKMIGDAAYESLWYDLKPNRNRDLLLVIVRSQRQLTLTIGKFVELSLKQFGNVVKASVSYVSVLYAMY